MVDKIKNQKSKIKITGKNEKIQQEAGEVKVKSEKKETKEEEGKEKVSKVSKVPKVSKGEERENPELGTKNKEPERTDDLESGTSDQKKTKETSKASKKSHSAPKNGASLGTREPETMAELLEQTGYALRGFKRGQIVEGAVVSVTPREVLIDVNGKTEGIVAEKELLALKDILSELKIGEKVQGMIISTENDAGQMVLSLRKAGMDLRWKKMEEKLKTKEAVEVVGAEVNKGGLIAVFEGLRGFIPSSQLAYSHGGKANELLNRRIRVAVIEVNQGQNRLIFSEKALGEKVEGENRKAALTKIAIGESYSGAVTGVVPYGLFINVEGIDGLVHISEIAWEKVNTPADYFKVGDKVKVVVLGIEESSGKLNLSIKQLTPDPWKEAASKYTINHSVHGKVSRMSNFGAFVTLESGIEGLIHVSKIPVGKEFASGEEVECTIESVDIDKRRISLAPILHEKPMGYK